MIKITGFTKTKKEIAKKHISSLKKILLDDKIELIGACAVPMKGKQEIDIMIISLNMKISKNKLIKLRYAEGPLIKRTKYLSKKDKGIKIDVQIMTPENKMINIHRKIIKNLKENSRLKKDYENAKIKFKKGTEEEYKKKKLEWINHNLLKN